MITLKTVRVCFVIAVLCVFLKCSSKLLKVDDDAFKAPEEFQETGVELSPPVTEGTESTAVGVVPPTKSVQTKKKGTLKKEALKVFSNFTGEVPFLEGERLQYLLSYFSLKGGTLTLEVRPSKEYLGRSVYDIHGQVKSSFLVNLFYKVDDWIDVYLDREKLIPLRGSFSLNETAQVKQRVVLYDHAKGKAKFWSKMVHVEKGNEELNREDVMRPGTQEMFSALYFLRALRPQAGRTYTIPVYENNKNWDVVIRGLEEEFVHTRLGTYRAVKVSIQVSVGGNLAQKGEILAWIDTGPRALLVKFSAKVKLGELRGILVTDQKTSDRLNWDP